MDVSPSLLRNQSGGSHEYVPGLFSSKTTLSNEFYAAAVAAISVLAVGLAAISAAPAFAQEKKPNILVIWGDDIGGFNISAYNQGEMGYRTPNIDRIAKEGAMFTDWYGQQSCTAGRAAFITGQAPIRTGLTKVGLPGAPEGMKAEDPTSPRCSSRWAMQRVSLARTTSVTATTCCRPFMASMSSSATFTT